MRNKQQPNGYVDMPFIDSHCHLHDARVIPDMDMIVERASTCGVKYMVSCATMECNFDATARLSKKFPSIIPCFGIHPWFVDTISQNWKNILADTLESSPSGVGETGLDFTDKTVDREVQIDVFTHQLTLAKELERPVNIHIRKAWEPFIHLLKKIGRFNVPGLVHSYSGSADMVPILEKYGLYLSFSGSVTNPGAKKVIQALKKVSQTGFVLETDSPDIMPYQQKKDGAYHLNEPANLPAIAAIAADRIGIDVEIFTQRAFDNALALFDPILKKRITYGRDR